MESMISSKTLRKVQVNRSDVNSALAELMKELLAQQKKGYFTYEWKTYTLEEQNSSDSDSDSGKVENENLTATGYSIKERIAPKIVELVVKKLRDLDYDVSVTKKRSLADTEETVVTISWETYMAPVTPATDMNPPVPVTEMDEVRKTLSTLDPGPAVVTYSGSSGESPTWDAWLVFDKSDSLFFKYMLNHCARIEERQDGYCAYAQSMNSRFYTARQAQAARDRFMDILKNYTRPYEKEDTSE